MGAGDDRKMGLWMTSALVVGTMIGAGIFMLPMSLAPLGANAIIGWVISSFGALCIAFALARLSTLGGDGIQANIERQLGATTGFLVAWAFWVSNWVGLGALAIAGASALSWVDPDFTGPGFVIPAAIAGVVLLSAVNVLGVRSAGRMQIATVMIKLLPLAAVILLLALRGVSPEPFEPLAPVPIDVASIGTAVALTFFALLGFENATAPVGKVRDPARTIPRAILGGTLFVALVYLLASTSVQLLLPAETAASSPAPVADVIAMEWGGAIASLAAIGIAVAAFGALNGGILSTGELGYSMALRRDLPQVMARTWRGNTPVVAQLAGSGLSILLILANGSRASASLFTFLILLTTAAILVVYLAGTIAAWRLSGSAGAKLLLGCAFLFILFAGYGSGLEAILWCLALLAAGLILRTVVHGLQPKQQGRPESLPT
ncbi:MAG TPA: amino acid permease [Allosphingosinicella sp.]|nr:amino acid permease [Allosphingosinicella sp.]